MQEEATDLNGRFVRIADCDPTIWLRQAQTSGLETLQGSDKQEPIGSNGPQAAFHSRLNVNIPL